MDMYVVHLSLVVVSLLGGAWSSCTDKLPNCDGYGASMCTNYRTWAAENCCTYCRLSPPLQTCVDKYSNCHQLTAGVCTSLEKWAKTNCCRYCSEQAPPTAGNYTASCVDKVNNCPRYGKDICLKYSAWATNNCCAFCAYSSTAATPVGVANTVTSPLVQQNDTCDNHFTETTCQQINACSDPKYRQYCRKFCNLCCHDETSGNCSQNDACASIVSALRCKKTCGLCECHDQIDCSSFRQFCLVVDEITLKCSDTCGLCRTASGGSAFG